MVGPLPNMGMRHPHGRSPSIEWIQAFHNKNINVQHITMYYNIVNVTHNNVLTRVGPLPKQRDGTSSPPVSSGSRLLLNKKYCKYHKQVTIPRA